MLAAFGSQFPARWLVTAHVVQNAGHLLDIVIGH